MATFAVIYTYSDDAAKRDEYRAEHRNFLNSSGWTLLSGPLKDPAGALLIVEADDLAAAEKQLVDDPFRVHGCVAEARIREFEPVGGNLAEVFVSNQQ